MDIGKSIGYVFEDRNWVAKVLIGGVITAIPILDLAALGYGARTLRNVALGEERPLPEWSDFGDLFVKGLLVFLAGLIYSLPAAVLNGLTTGLGYLIDSSRGAEGVTAVLGGCIAVLACLQGLIGLLVGLWLPAAVMNFATNWDFASFFHFGEIWGLISRNLGDYIVALIVAFVVTIAAVLVGLPLCLIGVIFTLFIATLIAAHLLGQVLRQSGRAITGT